MTESYADIEDHILEAIDSVKGVEKPNLTQLVIKFTVPYHQLQARYNGHKSRSDREPTNR